MKSLNYVEKASTKDSTLAYVPARKPIIPKTMIREFLASVQRPTFGQKVISSRTGGKTRACGVVINSYEVLEGNKVYRE